MSAVLHVQRDETTRLITSTAERKKASEKARNCYSCKGDASFDTMFLSRLWKLLCILRAYPAILLPLLSILNAHYVAQVGKLTGKFYAVYINGDHSGFSKLVYKSIGLFLIASVLYAVMQFLGELFAYIWRRKLTTHLLDLYARDQSFYWLKDVDNPDQRIAQDLSLLCTTLGKLLTDLAAMPYNLYYYTYHVHKQLQSISILLATYAWFIGGTIVLKLLIHPAANLLFEQEACEGYFRKGLMRLVQQNKEIAASNGWKNEQNSLIQKLTSVLWYQLRVVLWNFLITLFSRGYQYFGSLVNFLCIAHIVFSGKLADTSSGSIAEGISNTSFYLLMLLYTFSQVPESAEAFSKLLGLTPRVSQLIERLSELKEEAKNHSNQFHCESEHCYSRLNMESEAMLKVRQFSCWAPSGRLIVKDLNLFVKRGESLLITGESGIGKSTLLLAFMELYNQYHGSIECLPASVVMMLPQQALVAPGSTLASQLTYPSEDVIIEDQIVHLLEEVGLGDVWKGWCDSDLSTEQDWSKVFSTGELQRIALARVFFHKPQLLFLDEATSALPSNIQGELYLKLKAKGITFISVGQRNSLHKLHKWNLHLQGSHHEGLWTFTVELSA